MIQKIFCLLVFVALIQEIKPQATYEFCDMMGFVELIYPKGKETLVDVLLGCYIKHLP